MSDPELYKKRKELILSLIKSAINNPKDCGLYFRNQYAPETMGVWDKGNLATFEVGMLPTILWNWSAIKKDINFYNQELGIWANIINGDSVNDPQNPNFVIKLLEDKGFQDFIKKNEEKLSIFIKTLTPHMISMSFFKAKKKEDPSQNLKKALKTNSMTVDQKAEIYDQLEKAGFDEAYMQKEAVPVLVNFLIEGIKHYPEVVKAVGSLPVEKERYKVDPALLRTVVNPVVEQTKIGQASYDELVNIAERVAPKVPLLKEWLDKYPLKGGPGALIVEELRVEAERKNRLQEQRYKDLSVLNRKFNFLEDPEAQAQNSPNNRVDELGLSSSEEEVSLNEKTPESSKNESPSQEPFIESPVTDLQAEEALGPAEEASPKSTVLEYPSVVSDDEPIDEPIAHAPEPSPKVAQPASVSAPNPSFWRRILTQIKDFYHAFISKVKAFFSRFIKKQTDSKQVDSALNAAPPKVISLPIEDNQPINDSMNNPINDAEPLETASPEEPIESQSFKNRS